MADLDFKDIEDLEMDAIADEYCHLSVVSKALESRMSPLKKKILAKVPQEGVRKTDKMVSYTSKVGNAVSLQERKSRGVRDEELSRIMKLRNVTLGKITMSITARKDTPIPKKILKVLDDWFVLVMTNEVTAGDIDNAINVGLLLPEDAAILIKEDITYAVTTTPKSVNISDFLGDYVV